MTKRQILELIEYLSWGFSGWGAVAALISGDLSYAVIPLMFTVGFNLLSQQQYKRLHLRHEREIEDLSRRINSGGDNWGEEYARQIEQLSLTQQQTFNAINQRLAQLDVRSQQLSASLSSGGTDGQTQASNQTLNQRLAQVDSLAQQLAQVRQVQQQNLVEVERKIDEIKRFLQTYQTQLPGSSNEAAIKQELATIQEQFAALQNQLKQSGSNQRFSQLDGLNQQVVALKQQVDDVRKAQQQNISSFSQRLSQVDVLQQQLAQIQGDIQAWRDDQERGMEALNHKLSQQVMTTNKSNSQIPANIAQRLGQLDNLAQVVRSQQQQFEEFQTTQQQSLHMLNQKLFQLDELVRGRLINSNSQHNSRNGDNSILSDLQQQMQTTQVNFEELRQAQQKSFDVINQRLAQLDALVRQFDARTKPGSIASEDVTSLNKAQQQTVQTLNTLNSRISQVDATTQKLGDMTRQEIGELRQAIAELKLQVEQLFAASSSPGTNRRQPLPGTSPTNDVPEGTVIIPPVPTPTSPPAIIPPTPNPVSISSPKVLRGHDDRVLSLGFSPDGTKLASVGVGNQIHIWYLDRDEHRVFSDDGKTSTNDSINSIAFSPDGTMVVTGGDDRLVKLWDVSTGELIRTIRGHDSKVYSVAFHPDGDMLASCSRDRTVKLWSTATGRELETLRGHTDDVIAIAFSPRGEIIASGAGGYDQSIKIWHLEQHKFLTIAKHTDNVCALACSPDGKSFASGSWDTTIKLWFLDSGKEIMSLSGHTDHVYAIAFSPDGRVVASGSRDKTVKLWSLDTGTEIRTFTVHDDDVNTVAFSPNGRYLATGSSDHLITIIPLSEILGSGGGGRRTQLPMRIRSND